MPQLCHNASARDDITSVNDLTRYGPYSKQYAKFLNFIAQTRQWLLPRLD